MPPRSFPPRSFRGLRRPAQCWVIAGAVAASACSPPPAPVLPQPTANPAYACPAGDLLIEGGTTDQSLLERRVEDYSAACRNRARLTVSTAKDSGVESLVNGLVHIAAADSPLDAEQAKAAAVRCLKNPAWHLPVAVDPVAVIHRVDGVPSVSLRPATLARVFSGLITRWNDPAIAADNPGVTLPDQRIEVVSRSGRTGVTEALGDYLNRQAPDQWPVSGTQSWRGAGQGFAGAQETIDAVTRTPYSIGYVEYSALPRSIASPTPLSTAAASVVPASSPGASAPAAPGATPSATPGTTPTPQPGSQPARLLVIEQGGRTELTPASASRAVSGIRARADGPDVVIDPASLAADGGWPIHRVTYQVVCSAGLRPEVAALQKDWVGYLVADENQETLPAAGRIALPVLMRQRVRDSVVALR